MCTRRYLAVTFTSQHSIEFQVMFVEVFLTQFAKRSLLIFINSLIGSSQGSLVSCTMSAQCSKCGALGTQCNNTCGRKRDGISIQHNKTKCRCPAKCTSAMACPTSKLCPCRVEKDKDVPEGTAVCPYVGGSGSEFTSGAGPEDHCKSGETGSVASTAIPDEKITVEEA